jgi:hypothetical protein
MWLMALLVNSNTLEEMTIIWRNICVVLLSPSQNDQFKISLSILSKMADDMNKDPDKTNFILKNVSVTSKGQCNSTIPEEVRTNTLALHYSSIVERPETQLKMSIQINIHAHFYANKREIDVYCSFNAKLCSSEDENRRNGYLTF